MRPDDFFLLFIAAGYKSLFKRLQQQTSCLDALLTGALTLSTCTGIPIKVITITYYHHERAITLGFICCITAVA